MEAVELKAYVRTETGKGPARRFRMKGLTPAVFYGRGEEAIPLSVNVADLSKIIKTKKENIFIKLRIEGEKSLEKLTMIKELQIEPVSRRFYHADFYEIRMDHKLTVDVPLRFVGTPIGVENGGELQHLKRELKVSCLPAVLPEHIDVDVSGLDIGSSLKVQDLRVPEGVEVLDPGDVGVAIVAFVKVSVPKEETTEGEPAAPDEDKEAAAEDAKS
jgi:large subunit ribosomal protein L25